MKKLLFLAVAGIVGTFNIAHAQIEKGNAMWGGDLLGIDLGLNKGSGYSINISPSIGYFVRDNLAVGGYLNLGVQGAKNSSTIFNYAIGALARYYVSPGQYGIQNPLKHGRFFLDGRVGFGGQSISKGGGSTNGLNLVIGPGYAYFITPNVGLEGLVQYNGIFGNGTSSRIQIGLGFQVYLPSSHIKSIIKDPSQL